ncbi:efflux RND transporter periplasmic adaptor subunit [Rubrivivax sp. RP6-9]|uniref:efflux RND transporter periplasmic adaptor subunit n=1 Tax=Rubrivivax sp. RP6-9 TaxID=3415750 RepID=UPI003CC5AF51
MNNTHSLPALTLALLVAAVLAACSGKDAASGGAPGGGMPPPPAVGVVTVAPQAVALQTELPGRVEALRTAQVRARVNGVVLQRQFREGSEVRAGQPLFQIDPAPYQAALASANAQLARAQASLAQATATVDRYRPLAAAQAISQQDFVNAQATQKSAEADVAAGRAAVQTASINLGYARVTAPIAGRIGRALVTEGALVSATEATQLALIQQTDRVYVNFTQSSSELLRLRKALAANQLKASQAVDVRVVLDDGSELPRPGKLLFSDLTVDASSGQVTLRAEVPNAEGLLLPGQFVRVRLSQAELPAGFLVPQQAVTRTNQGDTVLVVGEGNKPAPRTVKVSAGQGGQWVVTDGLKPGEQVIVDGFQKMFVPGAPVNPVPWSPAGAASAAAPAAPAASK